MPLCPSITNDFRLPRNPLPPRRFPNTQNLPPPNDYWATRKWVKKYLETRGTGSVVEGTARPLPDYLYALDFADSYEAEATAFYEEMAGDAGAFGCSAVRRGNNLFRNYDWPFDDAAEFVVRVSGDASRFSSVGVASVGKKLTDAFVKSGKWSKYYKCLPGMTLDGINERGVVAEINVDGGPRTGWHGAGANALHILAAVRWVLDHGTSAAQAAQHLAENVKQPDGELNFHFMIADATETYIVENGEAHDVTNETKVLTNYAVFGAGGGLGEGVERYDLLASGGDITDVWFTKAYQQGNDWHSDFGSEAEHASAIAQWAEQGATKEAHRNKTTSSGKAWWQTVHTSIYDFANKTLKVAVQESEDYYTFALIGSGASVTLDDAVTEISENGVKSSGIWRFVKDGEAGKRDKNDYRVYRKRKDVWRWTPMAGSEYPGAPEDFLETANAANAQPLRYSADLGGWFGATQFWPNGNRKYLEELPPGGGETALTLNFAFTSYAEDGETELGRFEATATRESATDETLVYWDNEFVRLATTETVEKALRRVDGLLEGKLDALKTSVYEGVYKYDDPDSPSISYVFTVGGTGAEDVLSLTCEGVTKELVGFSEDVVEFETVHTRVPVVIQFRNEKTGGRYVRGLFRVFYQKQGGFALIDELDLTDKIESAGTYETLVESIDRLRPVDDVVTEDSRHCVRSSGIWSLVDGAKRAIEDRIAPVAPSTDAPETALAGAKATANFVNSSINAFAAFYITADAQGNAFATKAALNAAAVSGEFYNGGVKRVPTKNDYLIVREDESVTPTIPGVSPTTRYSYDGSQWAFQYIVNNTALTQAQVDAINSGITSAKTSGYDGHLSSRSNPHGVTKSQVGLGNVDNTSDMAKPVSTAVQSALDGKVGTLDASAQAEGKRVYNATIGDIIRWLGGTITPAPGPTITKVTSDGPAEDDHLAVSKNHVLGTGLALGEGDHVYLRLIDTDGTVLEDNSQDHRVASSTDAEITSGDAGFWPDDSEYPDGEWDEEGRTVKLMVVKADGTSAERRVYLDNE